MKSTCFQYKDINQAAFFLVVILYLGISPLKHSMAQENTRPNVILIMTDDQGYGDFGFTGNPHVQTPVLDGLAEESMFFDQFYVSPVCAPTRASLMTGRYSLRTGIRDTYNGGAIMATEEVTIAEMLKDAGYRTGIFGKWHLGDNYPSRPMDQGFDESVIHLSGGMGQVGDITTYYQGDSSYFDPVLWHNGQQESYKGYCTDIFTQEAIAFVSDHDGGEKRQPFFVYLSLNAPHTPLQVPDEYYQKYKDIDPTSGLDEAMMPSQEMTESDKEHARRVYAMVENIDDNLGRLFQQLKALSLEENTIVIFMTDNGPQHYRYLAGMRGKKATVYQGGVRTPFLLKYPSKYPSAKTITTAGTHMDVLPTLSALCHAPLPEDRKIDGHSLVPLLEGESVNWADRPLFFYWTRRYPEQYQNMALQKGPLRLVAYADYDAKWDDFQLYDISSDHAEQQDLSRKKPAETQQLKNTLDTLYRELIASPHLIHQPVIEIGHPAENPSILNRNDAGGARDIWSQEEIYGKWYVKSHQGKYTIKFKFLNPVPAGGDMLLEVGPRVFSMQVDTSSDWVTMENVSLEDMKGDFVPFYSVKGKKILPFWVEVKRENDDQ
ncbi:arylsulfatase [Echinicola vietnamensis]|uniref:Arylsulfatase A family protein n=1 Tax=Echinicola vietnamensis (strain DSM 17526 / LMG 23754 / KMM 6221) TaxID=926556 RepID=L0FV21_ECHVK|nr:arylsulfatase [Echinicola vietnamensis]AGA77152.1 arylsulfatase A family protein [Echinicola vietnamensis DSM 17526]